MSDLLDKIVGLTALLIAVLVPILIIVQSIINARRLAGDHVMTVVYALSALAVWAILSFIIVMVLFMAVFEPGQGTSYEQEKRFTLIFLSVMVVYVLCGGGMIYLLRRRGRA